MLYQLMVYGGGSVVGDDGGSDSDAGSGDRLSESTDLMLDLLPNLYSNSNIFLCKG